MRDTIWPDFSSHFSPLDDVCDACMLGIQLTKMAWQLRRSRFQLLLYSRHLLLFSLRSTFPVSSPWAELSVNSHSAQHPRRSTSRLVCIADHSFSSSFTSKSHSCCRHRPLSRHIKTKKTENGTRSRRYNRRIHKLRLFLGSSSGLETHFSFFVWFADEKINWLSGLLRGISCSLITSR